MTVTAGDPVIMPEGPLPATRLALQRAVMKIDDIDLYEVNEAFAPAPLAWLEATGADPQKLNVNDGAIAISHPRGASGTRLMTTLVHALRARLSSVTRFRRGALCAGPHAPGDAPKSRQTGGLLPVGGESPSAQ